ncbi:MAG TPA: thioredoxin domain-containing protein [Solirubrobacteraceae bacterium]|jgi:protein-disulfide isomerase|nr:thioredoxin domain-containing protein [Solirubrobacteraceae bacterium]
MSPVQSDEEDLTRKQRREQARAQRKELEQAEADRAVRRTRLTQLGVVVAAVVVAIVVVLVATGSGGKSKAPTHGTKEASKVTAEVSSLLTGIPQSGTVLGDPKAPVTLQYFADLECPICKDFTVPPGALPSLIQQWVRPGKLKIEYRNLETATREPEVFRTQQAAALAAGRQNKLWQFVETFYREQGEEGSGYVTEQYLQNLAQQVPGLSLAQWTAARGDQALISQITNDAQVASAQGFTGTPAFLIGKTGAAPQKLEYASLTDPASFNSAIEKQLKA